MRCDIIDQEIDYFRKMENSEASLYTRSASADRMKLVNDEKRNDVTFSSPGSNLIVTHRWRGWEGIHILDAQSKSTLHISAYHLILFNRFL